MVLNLQKLTRNRRGQVRGIDFALAMLIFIIAFSQIIIVLSNLLIPSLVQMETYSQEQELDTIYSNIFYSQGYPTNWGSIGNSYLSDFRAGLLGNQDSLDFTKINRFHPDQLDAHVFLAQISLFNSDIESCVTSCDHLLRILGLKRDIVLNSIKDLGDRFLEISDQLLATNISYLSKICLDIGRILTRANPVS